MKAEAKTASRTVCYTIPAAYNGKSLDSYLKEVHQYSRRARTRLKKSPEYVLRNGVHMDLPQLVFAGDVITLTVEEISYTKVGIARSVVIVYEDDDIILYNKPAGMPIHPSRNHQSDTLANVFTADMQSKGLTLPFRVLNRLDRDTSGLCLCAKSGIAAHALSLQQQDNTLKKEYTAVACGRLPEMSGTIEAPIARLDDFLITRVVSPDGQYAKTDYTVITQNDRYSLVKVILQTGRTHQIRVHFSHIGYPLAGDSMYGTADESLPGQALCCTALSFVHPSTGENMHFSVDIPVYMQKLLTDDSKIM